MKSKSVASTLLRMILTGLLFTVYSNAAQADDLTDICIQDCQDRRKVVRQWCAKNGGLEKECDRTARAFSSSCENACMTTVTIPDAKGLEELATNQAIEVWGEEVTLLGTAPYTGPEKAPVSYLFTFARAAGVPSLKAITADLLEGNDTEVYDDLIGCIEVGASLDRPPIVAFWTGISLETQATIDLQKKMKVSPSKIQLKQRYLSSILPLFEYEVNGKTLFYEPHRRQVIKDVKFKKGKERDSASRLAIRDQWVRALNEMD